MREGRPIQSRALVVLFRINRRDTNSAMASVLWAEDRESEVRAGIVDSESIFVLSEQSDFIAAGRLEISGPVSPGDRDRFSRISENFTADSLENTIG